MLRRALVLIPALSLLIAGCGKPEPEWGGVPREKPFASAVSLSPGATEIVIRHTNGIRVIGLTEECNFPIEKRTQPIVMSGQKPNYELIAKLAPDLVVYDADLFADADIQKFKDLGMKTFGFSGHTLEEFADSLFQYGKLAGGETDISEYVSSFLTMAERGRSEPLKPKPKVAILIPGSASEPLIAGLGSLQADVIRATGAEPVGPGAKIFVPVSAEWLVSTNPDAILIAGPSDSIEKDPRFQGISAIKNKRFAHVNQDIALRRGVRLYEFIREARSYLLGTNGGAGERTQD